MKTSKSEVAAISEAEMERAKALAKPGVSEISGVIVQVGEPTNALNLRVRLAAIHEEAMRIRAEREGR